MHPIGQNTLLIYPHSELPSTEDICYCGDTPGRLCGVDRNPIIPSPRKPPTKMQLETPLPTTWPCPLHSQGVTILLNSLLKQLDYTLSICVYGEHGDSIIQCTLG